ncbi:MAG: hypothetical protein ABI651_04970 [Verrucomicrobiota bacterium]
MKEYAIGNIASTRMLMATTNSVVNMARSRLAALEKFDAAKNPVRHVGWQFRSWSHDAIETERNLRRLARHL